VALQPFRSPVPFGRWRYIGLPDDPTALVLDVNAYRRRLLAHRGDKACQDAERRQAVPQMHEHPVAESLECVEGR
jgi:hypothetical protein